VFSHEKHINLIDAYEWQAIVREAPSWVFRPEVYHPPFLSLFSRNYFEGWYYKFVTKDERISLVVIIGAFFAEDTDHVSSHVNLDNFQEGDHGFIMVYLKDSSNSKPLYEYIRFELDEIQLESSHFECRFGKNVFTLSKVLLDITQGDFSISGELNLLNTKPWPISFRFPGVMGWFEYIPILECYHGVVSLDHDLAGTVLIQEKEIDFGEGKGYIEKDRGNNFPVSWTWMQANVFESRFTPKRVSFTLSLAPVPLTKLYKLDGILMGFLIDDMLYVVTTYTGGTVNYVSIKEGKENDNLIDVSLSLGDSCTQIDLNLTQSKSGSVVQLHAPTKTGMERRVPEHLGGQLFLTVWDLCSSSSKRVVFEGFSDTAAFELVGAQDLQHPREEKGK